MSITDQVHRGMVIRHDDHLYTVLDYRLAQTGKQKPTLHIKLRSIDGAHTFDRTLDQLGKLEEVQTEVRHMQYLYSTGSERVFMDTETYEQFPVGEDILQDALDFLVEEETYQFLTIEGRIVSMRMPTHVVMEVVDTAPVEHAGGGTNVQKDAKLASGLMVRVPLFIKNGDKIRIKIETREYTGKEH